MSLDAYYDKQILKYIIILLLIQLLIILINIINIIQVYVFFSSTQKFIINKINTFITIYDYFLIFINTF